MKNILKSMLFVLIITGLSWIQFPVLNSQEREEEVLVEVEEEIIVEEMVEDDEIVEEFAEDTEDETVEEIYEETAPVEADFSEEVPIEEMNEEVTPVSGEFMEYTIVKGDCLWFIADHFYQDPFLWPEIYKVNPYIKDPHWIYPDDTLMIPGVAPEADVEEFVSAEPVEEPAEELAEETIEEEVIEEIVEEEFEEIIEEEMVEEELEIAEAEIEEEVEKVSVEIEKAYVVPEHKKYVSSSFVAPLDWQFDGHVIGEVSQKLMVSQGDDIYIDIGTEQGMKPKMRCIVYRPGRKIKDRTTHEILGRVVRKIAVVQVGYDIEANVSTARVISSYDYIRSGDIVRIVKSQE